MGEALGGRGKRRRNMPPKRGGAKDGGGVKARGGPTALELQTTAILARAAGRNVPYNTVRIPELLGYEG